MIFYLTFFKLKFNLLLLFWFLRHRHLYNTSTKLKAWVFDFMSSLSTFDSMLAIQEQMKIKCLINFFTAFSLIRHTNSFLVSHEMQWYFNFFIFYFQFFSFNLKPMHKKPWVMCCLCSWDQSLSPFSLIEQQFRSQKKFSLQKIGFIEKTWLDINNN